MNKWARLIMQDGELSVGSLHRDTHYRRNPVKPADVAVRRRHVHGAVETLELIDDPVHILDRDLAHPSRRRPLLPPVERQLQWSRDRRPADAEKLVGKLGGGGVLHVPAHHLAVKWTAPPTRLSSAARTRRIRRIALPFKLLRLRPMRQCIVMCAPASNAIVIMTERRAINQHEREVNI